MMRDTDLAHGVGPPCGADPLPRAHPVPRAHQVRGTDRGSLTLFVLFFAITALVLASLLVDVGSAVNAQERAADLAEQAVGEAEGGPW